VTSKLQCTHRGANCTAQALLTVRWGARTMPGGTLDTPSTASTKRFETMRRGFMENCTRNHFSFNARYTARVRCWVALPVCAGRPASCHCTPWATGTMPNTREQRTELAGCGMPQGPGSLHAVWESRRAAVAQEQFQTFKTAFDAQVSSQREAKLRAPDTSRRPGLRDRPYALPKSLVQAYAHSTAAETPAERTLRLRAAAAGGMASEAALRAARNGVPLTPPPAPAVHARPEALRDPYMGPLLRRAQEDAAQYNAAFRSGTSQARQHLEVQHSPTPLERGAGELVENSILAGGGPAADAAQRYVRAYFLGAPVPGRSAAAVQRVPPPASEASDTVWVGGQSTAYAAVRQAAPLKRLPDRRSLKEGFVQATRREREAAAAGVTVSDATGGHYMQALDVTCGIPADVVEAVHAAESAWSVRAAGLRGAQQ